jgi:membrane protease YdiL (CAAX protease family)
MSTDSAAVSFDAASEPIAPWWHTAFVLLILATGSVAGYYLHGFPNRHLPYVGARLSGYITSLAEEWLLVLLVWLWLKRRGLSIAHLSSGRWHNLRAFWRDLAFALGFLVVGIPLTSGLARLTRSKFDAASFLPHTALELAVYILLSLCAGFCEELVFRGYLLRQFAARTNSVLLGIGLQGLVFGLAHGYQGRIMAVIVIYGWLFGAFVTWRRSLLPAMLAHGLQDTAGGLMFFFFVK